MIDPLELLKQNAPAVYNSVMARKRLKLAEDSPKHQEPQQEHKEDDFIKGLEEDKNNNLI